MKHVTIEDAPAVLNTNDKAMWVLSYNEGVDATIKRLSAGVSVEPVAWLAEYGGDVYTATALAAARVQAIEECAKVCELKNPHPDQWSDQSEYVEKRVALACSAAIRALLGKEAT